ncbi:MAG: hypothetical protein MZV70_65620 [Desulfobacterales bacterium]|nr:hypothetical protein [Desulfobacterales bacterium]
MVLFIRGTELPRRSTSPCLAGKDFLDFGPALQPFPDDVGDRVRVDHLCRLPPDRPDEVQPVVEGHFLDKDTALLMGINTNRVFALTFGLGAACVGVGRRTSCPTSTRSSPKWG